MFELVKKLNIKNCVNSTGNCVHYIYGLFGFAEKLNIQNYVNSIGNCVHYMYGLSRFADKLSIQNCVIQQVIVYVICTKCLDLQKNWISKIG